LRCRRKSARCGGAVCPTLASRRRSARQARLLAVDGTAWALGRRRQQTLWTASSLAQRDAAAYWNGGSCSGSCDAALLRRYANGRMGT
jgi:hypothetical protein